MTTLNVTFAKTLTMFSILGAAATVRAGSPSAEPSESLVMPAASATPETPETSSCYALPWQLRPVLAEDMARIETTAAVFNDGQGNIDIAIPTVLAVSHRLTAHWAPSIRLAFVGNNAPGAVLDGTALANPLVGATYARALGGYRLALFGATTIPVGTGGGAAPNLRAAESNAAANSARPADAAMFAVNYLTEVVGADLAYVGHGFTVQGELTVLQYVRVRGGDAGGATDAFRTQAAAALHVGTFIGSHISLGADLHHRRWLSQPTAVATNAAPRITFTDPGMDTTTVAIGPRFHFRVGKAAWVRPGLSLVRGLDARGFAAPLITAQATAVQIDIPVTF